MQCPKCKGVELAELKLPHTRLAVDRCPTCKGMWFDAGEMERALYVAAKEVKIPSRARSTDHECPRGHGTMYSFDYPYTSVTIDMCKECHGTWLDSGEFFRIMEWREALYKRELRELMEYTGQPARGEDNAARVVSTGESLTMPCPRCQTKSFRELSLDYSGALVDRCAKCGGLWFDKGELEQVLHVAVPIEKVPRDAKKSDLRCPRCKKVLFAFFYPETHVMVDMCKKCCGIWLDHGEFKAIHEWRQKL